MCTCYLSQQLRASVNIKLCWIPATRKTYIMNRLWGPLTWEKNMKWKTEEKGGKSSCTESPIKPVLPGLYGSDLFYWCFNVKVLLFCFLVLMLLLLGLFIFLKYYFWKHRREIFKGRGEHVLCSGEALVHGLEFLQRLPGVPMHPHHLRCQQVRQVLTVLTTTQSAVKAHSNVPKPFQSKLCPSSGFVVKPGETRWF